MTRMSPAATSLITAAVLAIGLGVSALPAQAGTFTLSKLAVDQVGATAPVQAIGWVNKLNRKTMKRIRDAQRRAEYERKRRETATGQIKGKIVFTKPNKKN